MLDISMPTKRLYYRLIKDPGIISSFICYYTWGDWSHTEFVFKEGYLGARFNGGVAVRAFDYIVPVKEEFRYLELSEDNYNKAREFLYAQIGKPYDWRAIIGIGLRNDFYTNGKSWFCSEILMSGSQAASSPLLNIERVDRITPRDIGLSMVSIKDTTFNPLTYSWS